MSENLFRRKIIEHQGKWYLGEGKSIHRDLQQQYKDNDKLGHDDNSSFLASGTVKMQRYERNSEYSVWSNQAAPLHAPHASAFS